MKVPFRLRRRPASQPASALLLTTTDVAELLRLCGRLGGDALPRVFAVPGGFLLLPSAPTTGTFERAIRLRAISPNLLVPADAELVPGLWDDEARGLVRDRGLVFLPGGRVLAFAPSEPLAITALVAPPPDCRREWESLPTPEALADRLHEIVLDLPPPSVEDILEAGGEDIASEEPRPSGGGMLDTLKGKAAISAGKGLMGLGVLFGLKGLADLGARLVKGAVESAPRLTESILGRQEAALRELLRLFREGKLDQALRHALPIGGPGGRGGVPSASDRLPTHNLRYSLGSLLGNAGGRASIWFGGYDVQVELAKEYRQAASEAAARGDYRRAAFIYGKLLQDYRSAANVLFQGGLYRDAALLYLKQLDDRYWAARAFEAAGEVDTAVQLYRQLGRHVEAGNLLRRIGEEEAAMAEYRIAADAMVSANQDWLGAGELFNGVGWPEAAEPYWSQGWQHRPQKNAVACALRVAVFHQSRGAGAKLTGLVREARGYFDSPGNVQAASQFYNDVAKLADASNIAGSREEIRDLALVGVAIKLRQSAVTESRPGDTVASFLGQSAVWPPPVLSDAGYAYRAAIKERSQETENRAVRRSTGTPVGKGTVTACVDAPHSGDVFIAFDSGDLVCFRPTLNETRFVKAGWNSHEISALATDADGDFLLTVQLDSTDEAVSHLTGYSRRPNGSFAIQQSAGVPDVAEGISPLAIRENGVLRVALWNTQGYLRILEWPSLAVSRRLGPWDNPAGFGALLLPGFGAQSSQVAVLHWSVGSCCFHATAPGEGESVSFGWDLGKLRDASAAGLLLAWLQGGKVLELAGIDEEGALHWSRLFYENDRLTETSRNTAAPDDGYRAVAILRPGLVAGVTRTSVNWLRAGQRFIQVARDSVRTDNPVIAAFSSRPTQELLLVCSDGVIERLPVSNV